MQITKLLQLPVDGSSQLNFFPDGYQLIDSNHGQWSQDPPAGLPILEGPHWSQAGARPTWWQQVNGDRGYQDPYLRLRSADWDLKRQLFFYTVSSRLCIPAFFSTAQTGVSD